MPVDLLGSRHAFARRILFIHRVQTIQRMRPVGLAGIPLHRRQAGNHPPAERPIQGLPRLEPLADFPRVLLKFPCGYLLHVG